MPSRRPLLGAIGKHVVFCDGIDDYGRLPFSLSGSFTVISMFKCHGNALHGYEQYIAFEHDSGGADWNIGLTNEGTYFRFAIWDTTGTFRAITYGKLKYGTYYVGAGVYDEENLELRGYINGSLFNTYSLPNPMHDVANTLNIGNNYGGGRGFYGEIAYVLAYEEVLSDSDIQKVTKALKNWEQNIPVTDGLILGLTPYSLDCENGIWNDISGNNNNATLYGARCLWI